MISLTVWSRNLLKHLGPIHLCQRFTSTASERLNFLLKIMPAEKSTVLRHLRPKKDLFSQPAATASLQVIGDGSKGSPSVVMLIASDGRYLFNCGEGTQRFINEHKLRLVRVENIFFTTNSWKNIGGLPGLSLTVKDMGGPKLMLHGPEGIADIYSLTKQFMQVTGLQIDQAEAVETVFSDRRLTIRYITLKPDENHSKDPVNTVSVGSRKRRHSGSPLREASRTAVAYVGKLADKPGALLMNRCVELKVPPGPLLARLKDGEDVTLKDGTVVKGSEVCAPASPGPAFMVVECPGEEYLASLTRSSLVQSFQNSTEETDGELDVIVHFTPADVLNSDGYMAWMDRFPPSVTHLIVNESNHHPNTQATYRIQAQLNMLDSTIFPLLPAQRPQNPSEIPSKDPHPQSAFLTIPGKPLMSHHLRPKSENRLNPSAFVLPPNEEFQKEVLVYEGLKEALETYGKTFPSRPFVEDFSEPDVTFLGTGSAIPSKVRNVSGILLRISRDASMLLDCGEGTCGQFVRFFGAGRIEEEMRRLKAVYLSHGHADHHLGLLEIVRMRRSMFEKSGEAMDPLVVFAPQTIISFLEAFSTRFQPVMDDIKIIDCDAWSKGTVSPQTTKDVLHMLGLSEISLVQVIHCSWSYGISVTAKAGWKICYSADTMPCPALVEIGRNCNLLIHEATMEDGMEEEAQKKRHCTTSQAIRIGQQMQAKFTLLTHFSQRYAKIPLIKDDLPSDVGIAFDNMRVRLSDLSKIPAMMPVLKLMFTEHFEEMQFRTEKLERRREWERKNIPAATETGEHDGGQGKKVAVETG